MDLIPINSESLMLQRHQSPRNILLYAFWWGRGESIWVNPKSKISICQILKGSLSSFEYDPKQSYWFLGPKRASFFFWSLNQWRLCLSFLWIYELRGRKNPCIIFDSTDSSLSRCFSALSQVSFALSNCCLWLWPDTLRILPQTSSLGLLLSDKN